MTRVQVPADDVVVLEEAERGFFKRHKKDAKRARDVWRGLVNRRQAFLADPEFGVRIEHARWPRQFRAHTNLFLIEELPHRFRAVYTIIRHPVEGVLVQIEWIGDHREYDQLFGYSTS